VSGFIDPNHKARPGREVAARLKSAFAVCLALVVLLGGGWFVYTKVSGLVISLQLAPDYEGSGTGEVVVTIESGATTTEIADALVRANVVKSSTAFLNAVRDSPDAVNLQAGTYRMKSQMSATEALKLMQDPKSLLRDFVLVQEGLRLSQQLQAISDGTKIPLKDLEAAAKDKKALKLPSYAKNAEGFLFPNTYEITDNTTAAEILGMMSAQYRTVAKDVDVEGRASSLGVTPLQLVTIASIVEREVNKADDRPRVARVIYNRLAQKMKLQMDSTVHYAINDYTTVTTTDAQRATNSPYNTYKVTGLPPGPISAPGQASLEAAASPEAGDWLYFVTVNLDTGETRFAKTIEEHEANVALFQQWCQAHPGRC